MLHCNMCVCHFEKEVFDFVCKQSFVFIANIRDRGGMWMYSIPVSLQLNFYSMVFWYMENYAFSFSIKREKQILVASSRKLDASFQKM